MRGRPRVLMLTFPPHLRGPLPKLTAPLVATLESLGCELTIEVWGRHSDTESVREKIVGRVDDIRRIRRVLIRARPDLMLVHTSHDWKTLVRDVLLLLATRGRRTPTVLQMHGSQPEILLRPGNAVFKALSRWVVRMSDAVLVLSSDERAKWKQFYPEGKFYVVTNPFMPANVGRAAPVSRSRWRQAMTPGIPVLLFVGRLMETKGIFDLLDALARLKDTTQAVLLVVGDGEEKEEMQRRVQQLGLAQRETLAPSLEG
jgi:glycosyltransferase involved in cell wall biosynthesis